LDPPKYDPEKGIDEDYNLHMSEPQNKIINS